jgi:hypothetical protein
MRKGSVDNILVGGPEERSGLRSVFGLFDSGIFVGILGVGIVSVSPLVLPTQVVRVAVVVTDFVILGGVGQRLDRASGA